ncbi:hypothetical protein [Nocardia fluminea]|uniref:hypothetical protein n=1 Tax=Nocardia fluminea TaxID=134984 RepID=UPI00344A64BF
MAKNTSEPNRIASVYIHPDAAEISPTTSSTSAPARYCLLPRRSERITAPPDQGDQNARSVNHEDSPFRCQQLLLPPPQLLLLPPPQLLLLPPPQLLPLLDPESPADQTLPLDQLLSLEPQLLEPPRLARI